MRKKDFHPFTQYSSIMSTDEALPLQNLKNAFLLIFFFFKRGLQGDEAVSVSQCSEDTQDVCLALTLFQLPYQENRNVRSNYRIPAAPIDSRVMLYPYSVSRDLESDLHSSQSKETRQTENEKMLFCLS